MSTDYTSRYIDATVRSLPAGAQQDVRDELTASLADAIEARTDQGEERAEAERAVLTELGDPAVLAAGYAERPLHLIGPRFYLTWLRLLRLLLVIVVPLVAAVVGIVAGLSGGGVGDVIGEALGVGLSVGVHLTFWVTVIFAILDRAGADTGLSWSVDDLPEERSTGTGLSELVASLVVLGLALGAVVWDLLLGLARLDGTSVQVLHPALWPGWILALVAVLLLEAVLAIVLYRRGRWSTGLAVARTALDVAFVSWALTLLGRGMLLNPELLDFASGHGVTAEQLRVAAIVLGITVVGVSTWDAIDGWLKTARDRRR